MDAAVRAAILIRVVQKDQVCYYHCGLRASTCEPKDMPAYVFLCDAATEEECLRRKLAGTTQQNVLWVVKVQIEDTLYIYNFQSGTLHGPLIVTATLDCHEPLAWGGRFPVQVRVERAEGFRSVRAAEFASPATLKVLRRGGPLNSGSEKELRKRIS